MTDIPLVTVGGTPGQPLLHLAPANGFVLETYVPLLRPFFADFHVVAIPPRALWQPTPPPIGPHTTWKDDVSLIREAMTQHQLAPMIGLGHSFGAVTTFLAGRTGLFHHIILLDPTFLVRQFFRVMADLRHRGQALDNPLAQGALRRRRIFASVEDAYANFRSKPVFAQWSDETLRLYAAYGTRPTETGERTLTWSPEWEAFYFSTTIEEDFWDVIVPHLHEEHLPGLVLRGATSDTYTAESARVVADAWPQAVHQEIAGHGHLFPQSAPDITAQHIRAWMMTQGLIQTP